MPGFGTTDRTYHNAVRLMELLGVTQIEIPIRDSVTQHLRDINHSGEQDITYENAQARIRTLILMDLANERNGLVIGTGDMSELALGWMTYAGDHISMYGINAGIPKTMVQFQIRYAANYWYSEEITSILMDIIQTPISPELLPTDDNGEIAQRTEDKVGPYELHDFFMYHFLRYGFTAEKVAYMASLAFEDAYSEDEIRHWIEVFRHRFYTQQFKRSCQPDGPKVIGISLSPRGDWRMPSDVNEME
jgi:NAD+ synthase (glutamine-hydrolysing)